MCFGAAFIASNSSSSFKVRKVYLTQHPLHDYKIKISPISDEDLPVQDDSSEITYNKETVLYKTDSDYLGQKKTINISYDRNMRVDIYASSTIGTET